MLGKITLGNIEKTATRELLQQHLSKIDAKGKEEPILLKADKTVPYGQVASIMDDIKNAGFRKLGVITKHIEEKQ